MVDSETQLQLWPSTVLFVAISLFILIKLSIPELVYIASRLDFIQQIEEYAKVGIDFKNYIYQPDVNPCDSSLPLHHIEDIDHISKKHATQLLTYGFGTVLPMAPFFQCATAGVTSLSLFFYSSKRDKMNVADSQVWFAKDVQQWMLDNGHKEHANYIGLFRRLIEALDASGLSELHRSQRIDEYLEYADINVLLSFK